MENISNRPVGFALEKENYIILAVGVVVVLIGFILMSGGATTDPNAFYPNGDPSQTPEVFNFQRISLAPMLVIAGFAIEFVAIMANADSKFMKFIFRK